MSLADLPYVDDAEPEMTEPREDEVCRREMCSEPAEPGTLCRTCRLEADGDERDWEGY